MMKFEIYILQKKSQDPKMYQEAMGEYLKRLGAYAKVSVVYKKNAKQVEKILKEYSYNKSFVLLKYEIFNILLSTRGLALYFYKYLLLT